MLKTIISILIGLCVVNIIISLILGHISNYYNNNVRSIFSGVIGSLFAIISILLIFSVTKYKYSKTALTVNFVILTILSLLGIIFQFLLGFYFGGWACLVWLLSGLLLGYQLKFGQKMRIRQTIQVQKTIPLNQKVKINTLDSIQTVIPNQSQSSQNNKKCTCFRSCCHPCCSITTLIFMTLYVSVAIVCYSNFSQYPAYGKILEIQNQSGSQTYYIHAFCIGQSQPSKPTIVIEHGGGSNSIAFVEFGKQLNKKNWKLCSYDRLGYGRSSLIPRYLTREQSAYITNQVIKKLLENDTNKNIIIGGWSAGVEISQIYKKIYPNNVKGMIFLDGYPDYLSLMAIYDNKSEPYNVNTLQILQIIRILQPLGLVFIPGANPIQNQTSRNYYRAYYQTGYYWQSQYFDVLNPYSTTGWLTDKAGPDTVPYPNAKFTLNWPDIDIPLLVLPANLTIYGQQYKGMYQQQCNKYIQKCTNLNKKLTIMKGDHGFILQIPEDVATQIDIFFSPLF